MICCNLEKFQPCSLEIGSTAIHGPRKWQLTAAFHWLCLASRIYHSTSIMAVSAIIVSVEKSRPVVILSRKFNLVIIMLTNHKEVSPLNHLHILSVVEWHM